MWVSAIPIFLDFGGKTMFHSRTMAHVAAVSTICVAAMVAGCAPTQEHSLYLFPKNTSAIDRSIAGSECAAKSMKARKAYLAAHPDTPKVGFDTPATRRQQAVHDACMKQRGGKLHSRWRT